MHHLLLGISDINFVIDQYSEFNCLFSGHIQNIYGKASSLRHLVA
jgi:hypothetical protein